MSADTTANPPEAAPSQPQPRPGEEAPRQAGEEILEGIQSLAKNANAALNGLSDAAGLTPRVEQNPYGMIAAALGAGYVVGGGLFTPTTMRLVRLGMKLASVPMVRDRLLDAAEAALDGVLESSKNNPESK
jgi:hypothetical protein